jgi:hypothetical protein
LTVTYFKPSQSSVSRISGLGKSYSFIALAFR